MDVATALCIIIGILRADYIGWAGTAIGGSAFCLWWSFVQVRASQRVTHKYPFDYVYGKKISVSRFLKMPVCIGKRIKFSKISFDP